MGLLLKNIHICCHLWHIIGFIGPILNLTRSYEFKNGQFWTKQWLSTQGRRFSPKISFSWRKIGFIVSRRGAFEVKWGQKSSLIGHIRQLSLEIIELNLSLVYIWSSWSLFDILSKTKKPIWLIFQFGKASNALVHPKSIL